MKRVWWFVLAFVVAWPLLAMNVPYEAVTSLLGVALMMVAVILAFFAFTTFGEGARGEFVALTVLLAFWSYKLMAQ